LALSSLSLASEVFEAAVASPDGSAAPEELAEPLALDDPSALVLIVLLVLLVLIVLLVLLVLSVLPVLVLPVLPVATPPEGAATGEAVGKAAGVTPKAPLGAGIDKTGADT
jgi:hypothetical protein